MKKLYACLALLICTHANAIVITSVDDGSTLASNIEGSDVSIDFSSINYVGSSSQAGTFTGGIASGIGIDAGIILTSGTAADAAGPNTSTSTTTELGAGGDSDLSDLVAGVATFDANILEFEFTTPTGDLFFDFVFASEEYNEFLDFVDPFGLFVDGVNYALAPDGQAIAVSTVNCGESGVDITGPNCSFFNNNDLGLFDIEYDGFTDVFTAMITGLGAGTHTMKIAISDATDDELDSAVFIEAGSFSGVNPRPVPAPAIFILILLALAFVFPKRKI
ncbi:choice-of-anchor L domain-containing protein [Glaciecola sp. 1036]|uniref:choice-of-anchor L domain-containing protein n=1 Tax=Alteromonadaceae TaxID=72275 RepID=UPI003CFD8333